MKNCWERARRIATSCKPAAMPTRRRSYRWKARLRDARSERGFRGERLQVIDPGIVPERPSSPNIPLNLAIALLAGLALPILYFTLRANFHEPRDVWQPADYRTPVRSRNE